MSLTRPLFPRKQTQEQTLKMLRAAGILDKVSLMGVRGYFLDQGKDGVNDRGIYDDAIFVIAPDIYKAFNANTDPSSYRAGTGTGANKGMASLAPGVWPFTLGLHRQTYPALRQAGTFTVYRDGKGEPYADIGDGFGINIHRGGDNTTSSLGCQTIPPEQWNEFINLVTKLMKAHGMKVIRYHLVENKAGLSV